MMTDHLLMNSFQKEPPFLEIMENANRFELNLACTLKAIAIKNALNSGFN